MSVLGDGVVVDGGSGSILGSGTAISEDIPDWVEGLKDFFEFVRREKRQITGSERKQTARYAYVLRCKLCTSGKVASKPKRKVIVSPEVTANSRSNFIRHLQRNHADVNLPASLGERNKKRKHPASSVSDLSDSDEQTTATLHGSNFASGSLITSTLNGAEVVAKGKSILPKYDQNGDKQKMFNDVLLNMIVKTGLPFNLLEKDAFVTLINFLDSRYQIPSRRTLKRLLSVKHEKISQHLKTVLKEFPSGRLHLLLDIWSSRQRISVIGVQVRFIKDWKLRQFSVGFSEFPGGHTAATIKKKVEDILRTKYGLSITDFFTVTADSAASIISAFKDPFPIPPSSTKSQCPRQLEIQDFGDTEANLTQPESSSEWIDIDSEDELLDIEENDIQHNISVDSNMDTAVDQVISEWSTEGGGSIVVRRNSCVAHLLQLGIKTALKFPKVDKLIKKVNAMITWFNKSNKELSLLKEKTGKGFVKPCDTRWNSTYFCLKRIFEEIDVMSITSTGEKITSKDLLVRIANSIYSERMSKSAKAKKRECLTDEDICQLKVLTELLMPLADLTNNWQGDGVTASTVIIGLIEKLDEIEAVKTDDDEDHDMEAFKTRLLELVTERFDTQPDQRAASVENSESRSNIVTVDVFNDKYYILATLLDPRCKTVPFESDFVTNRTFRNGYPSKSKVVSILKEEFETEKMFIQSNAEVQELESENHSLSQPSTSTSRETSSMNTQRSSSQPSGNKKSGLFSKVVKFQESQRSLNGESNEVDLYLAEAATTGACPLKYWRNMKDTYPVLASLATKILSMPASSGSVERLFSVAGSIISQRRCSMKISTAEQILLYKEYLRDGIKN